MTAFSFLPLRMPPPTSLIIRMQVEAHRQFVDARLVHVTGEAEQARAAVLRRAERGERRAAIPDDRRYGAVGLDVVQNGGALPRADNGRETAASDRGMPRLPSSDSSSAVSSPHSYAPAPVCV